MNSKISMFNQSMEIGLDSPAVVEYEPLPSHAEAQLFAESISANSPLNMSDQILDKFEGINSHLQEKREDLDEQLKVTTSSDDYGQMLGSMKDMSDYGFQTALAAKVISKCTQAVEKLTNLQ